MKPRMVFAITVALLFVSIAPAGAQDRDDDIAALRAAADAGDAKGQFALGNHYFRGRGVGQDYGQALAYFRKAADQGFAPAQNQLGTIYENGLGIPVDYLGALTFYRQAADQGYALAQYNLGLLYESGRGARVDSRRALDWFQKAADQGEPDAEEKVGFYYQRGLVVPQIFPRAMDWYHKAADQGFAQAQNDIGHMLQSGLGVPVDYEQALAWYYKAADHGNSDAQNNIGYMYEHGQGLETDYAQAQAWFYKAAGQGNSHAENNLGWMYELGQGFPQDAGRALAWYRASAEHGNTTGSDNLARLSAKLQSGDPSQWQYANASAGQYVAAQTDRRRKIERLQRQIAELEFDARQEDNLAAQMEQPSQGAGAAVTNTLGKIGAVKFRMEAEQYRAQAAHLREELTEFDAQPMASFRPEAVSAPPAPPATLDPNTTVDVAIQQAAALRAAGGERQPEQRADRPRRWAPPQAPSANAVPDYGNYHSGTPEGVASVSPPQSAGQNGPLAGCTGGWKIGTFKITASGNEQLSDYADVDAAIVDEAGSPALRGGFLSLVKGTAPDLPVYYGFNASATERLMPRRAVTLPIQVPNDPNQTTMVPLTVKYCASK